MCNLRQEKLYEFTFFITSPTCSPCDMANRVDRGMLTLELPYLFGRGVYIMNGRPRYVWLGYLLIQTEVGRQQSCGPDLNLFHAWRMREHLRGINLWSIKSVCGFSRGERKEDGFIFASLHTPLKKILNYAYENCEIWKWIFCEIWFL